MVRWYPRLNGQELEQPLRDTGGQRRQACCRVRGNHRVGQDLMTEQMCVYMYNVCECVYICICMHVCVCVCVCVDMYILYYACVCITYIYVMFTFTFHFHALEKEMATHSSILAWRIPGTGEPGGLPSMGSQSGTRLKRLSSSSSM